MFRLARAITKSSKKKDKREENCNLEGDIGMYKKQKRQGWDHKAYLMHQVLYIVQLPNEEGDMHIIIALGASCDPNLVSSAFYTIPIFPF